MWDTLAKSVECDSISPYVWYWTATAFPVNPVNSRLKNQGDSKTRLRTKGVDEWRAGGGEIRLGLLLCHVEMRPPAEPVKALHHVRHAERHPAESSGLSGGWDGWWRAHRQQRAQICARHRAIPQTWWDEKHIRVMVWVVAAHTETDLGAFNEGCSASLLDFSHVDSCDRWIQMQIQKKIYTHTFTHIQPSDQAIRKSNKVCTRKARLKSLVILGIMKSCDKLNEKPSYVPEMSVKSYFAFKVTSTYRNYRNN